MTLLPVDLTSIKTRTNKIGDEMPLDEFLENCDGGMFIDYDGFASEVILEGRVISDQHFYPSDLDDGIRKQLLDIQQAHGTIKVVWYNR